MDENNIYLKDKIELLDQNKLYSIILGYYENISQEDIKINVIGIKEED